MRRLFAVLLAVMFAWTLPAGRALGQAAGVKVIVNGVEVSLPAPAVLSGGQVMAPISGLFEPMGAIAAYYESDRSIVVSNRVRTTVRMRLGDPIFYVNRTARPLPVAPTLQGSHVYVPAQAIFSALGAWTKYEDADRTLYVSSQIRAMTTQVVADALQVRVHATGPVQVETNVLSSPDRLVVDFLHAALRMQERELSINGAGVTRIRTAQFQIKPYVSRMVFDLAQPVEVRVTTSATSYLVTLEVRPKGQVTSTGGPPGEARDPGQAAAAKIMGVMFEESGQAGRLVIDGSNTMEYKVREFVYPDRLAIDIQNAVFIPIKQEIAIDGPSIVSIRAAQFTADPPVTRVVVILKRKMNYLVSQSDGRLRIEINAYTARGHVVALDPGHGGRDPGAIGPTGLRESDAVLDIALRVRELMQRDGIRIVMIRETDATVELPDRPRLAREAGATIFVSIHANAHARTAVNGSETYYLTPQSLALAQMIQDELGIVLGIPSRGIKTANFVVLRDSGMPSVLVEAAFVSHADDEAHLRDATFRQRIAQAIHKGITRFLAIYPSPIAP